MFQFSKQHEESILIFDDLDILVPNESTITSMVQYRLSSLFIDKMNEIYLNKRRCVVIGIVNHVQLSQLHPSLCCSTMMKSIITIPKLDKQRRLAILQKCLPSQYEESFYLQLAEETSSYSTADLHSFCSYCLQHPQQELILQQLNQLNVTNLNQSVELNQNISELERENEQLRLEKNRLMEDNNKIRQYACTIEATCASQAKKRQQKEIEEQQREKEYINTITQLKQILNEKEIENKQLKSLLFNTNSKNKTIQTSETNCSYQNQTYEVNNTY